MTVTTEGGKAECWEHSRSPGHISYYRYCDSGHTGDMSSDYSPGDAAGPEISPELPLGTREWAKVPLTGWGLRQDCLP